MNVRCALYDALKIFKGPSMPTAIFAEICNGLFSNEYYECVYKIWSL